MKTIKVLFICLCIVLGFSMDNAMAQRKINVEYCAYSVGSTQYIWTVAHASLINKYSKLIQANPTFCGAETAVVKLLGLGKIHFGEVNNLEIEFAKRGEWGYSKHPEESKMFAERIRAVFFQPYGAMQMVTLATSNITSYKDLKGKKVSLGSAQHTAHPILKEAFKIEGLDWEKKDYAPVYMSGGSGQAPNAVADGSLDANYAIAPSALPAVLNIATLNKIRLFGFSSKEKQKEFFDMVEGKYGKGLIRPHSCPPGLYGSNQVNTEPTNCIAFDLVIATRVDLEDEVVYEFTKSLFDHLDEFYETAGIDSRLITLEGAVKNVGFPFHPGALRYYREKGLIK